MLKLQDNDATFHINYWEINFYSISTFIRSEADIFKINIIQLKYLLKISKGRQRFPDRTTTCHEIQKIYMNRCSDLFCTSHI